MFHISGVCRFALGGPSMTQVVGKATPRVEGEAKVTGKAQYSADLNLPETLWGRCLRSPIPYGRIKRVDTSKAWQISGVKAVITGNDVAGLRIGRCIYDTPIMADGLVRFIGEKVAAGAGGGKGGPGGAGGLVEGGEGKNEPRGEPGGEVKESGPIVHPDLLFYKELPGAVAK